MSTDRPAISVVIPFYNEEGSLAKLHSALRGVLAGLNTGFEIIYVDDGSTDASLGIVTKIAESDAGARIISLGCNSGKARALAVGFKAVKGDIVFTMDADLQDDPAEIPNFLKKLDEGYDLVSGWKKVRHDPLEKRLPSKLFNATVSLVTGLKLHDFNCGFKAYRREILDDVKVYGELHRYIPALAHWQGYKVGEIPVQHHPREFGTSKYGWERYLRGFFDLFTVVLLTKYIRTPIYLFGSVGMIMLIFGLAVLSGITYLQLAYGTIFGHRPLSYLAVLSILFGSQSLSLGLLSEMLTHNAQRRGESRISIKQKLMHAGRKAPEISVVVPICNEAENLPDLHARLRTGLADAGVPVEIILVDDGSTDGSGKLLREIFERDPSVCIIQLRKRFGKAAALQAGFDASAGNIIITMDGDLQDQPEEIVRFLLKIREGYDLVLGRRENVPASRRFSSALFNRIVSSFTHSKVHDINCGFKAFRRHILGGVRLYGEFQRYFPLLIKGKRVRMAEIPVAHRARVHGVSKYGVSRIPRAFFDLFAVILLSGYARRPLHLFGLVGVLVGAAGFAINAYLTVLKILTGNMGDHYTLLLVGVMLMVLGLQWFSTGILSELVNSYQNEE